MALGVFGAVSIVGAVITWFRVPGPHRDRVWAEDGNIFLAEALDYGPWSVLFHGYAGYQHFVPRLVVASILPFLDLASYAVVVFAICSVLTGLVGGAVFWLSRDLVTWFPARVALGLITAVIPLASQETVGNLADLHTYAMWLAPWLLLYRARHWASSVTLAFLAWAVVMTEIQAVFFFFLIFFRLRERRAWPIFGGFLLASGVQILTAMTGDRDTSNGPLSIPSTVVGWMINTVMPLATADPDIVRRWVSESGIFVAIVILLPILAAATFAVIYGSSMQRLLVVALLLGSAAIYTGSAWANSDWWFMYVEVGLDNIDRLIVNIRYGVASGMMLVAVVPIAASIAIERAQRNVGRAVPTRLVAWGACVTTVAVLTVACFSAVSLRGWVGSWTDSVHAATVVCASDDAPERVTLPVAPDRSVDLNCDDVLRLARD